MDKETAKLLRHLPLGLTIDGLLALLIGGPIWAVAHTPDNMVEPFVAALWWWPWAAAVMVGLVIWYGICEDRELVGLVAEAPRLIVYAVVLLVTAPWWVPQVGEESLTPNPSPEGEGRKETK